ncbi:dimethylargininase [Desertivibrio insolitus]|uniref:dimethylargininase n=1 Tax=Herbiconiux sp. SYSU D00978 TaxID=2812562 RepID=UPI001A961AA6|nr:dimethylargininase [Herbiconiux sp. SYSU D00978]
MKRLLVRRPSPRLEDGELTHLDRQPVDPDLALRQWEAYVDAYRSRGWDIVEVDAADQHPDGVFVEDVVVMFGDLAVLTNPGAESRQGEVESMARTLEQLGVETARITSPGTLEGGDVLKIGPQIFVGASSRTNAEGIAQLRAIVEPRGYVVTVVPVTKVLHLKSAVTALPDGIVIGYPPLVDDASLFGQFLSVPEAHGNAVVVLDERSVLISDNAPETAELLRGRGLDVLEVPVGEFEKLEGCVTCLSVRVREREF